MQYTVSLQSLAGTGIEYIMRVLLITRSCIVVKSAKILIFSRLKRAV